MPRAILVALNTLSFVLAIIVNILAGSGAISNKDVGEVSRQYDTLFAPAGYAFSIWGIIYLLLAAFAGFNWVALIKKNNREIIDKTGLLFILSNLANAGWLYLWVNEYIGFSVLVILLLLLSLIILVFRLKLEIWDAPLRIILFVWWPFAIYLGWIIVAALANVAAFFTSLKWESPLLTPQIWTILMIGFATAIYLFLIFTRNLRESALVGIWAFIAIAIKQRSVNSEITISAIAAALVLLIAILYHAYKNLSTTPLKKLKRGEF